MKRLTVGKLWSPSSDQPPQQVAVRDCPGSAAHQVQRQKGDYIWTRPHPFVFSCFIYLAP